ncbi:MAG: hypothetical protein ACKO2Z_23500 [Sphaerospermopsis kisseleviana]
MTQTPITVSLYKPDIESLISKANNLLRHGDSKQAIIIIQQV